MDTPEEDASSENFVNNITIPSALITKRLGDNLKKALDGGEMVNVYLDWRESLPHPDERVEYEFWTNSNDECGPKCEMQLDFVRDFKGMAQVLGKKGYTQFTPHYITWYCHIPLCIITLEIDCVNYFTNQPYSGLIPYEYYQLFSDASYVMKHSNF
jgi:hypothetical protein